MGASGSIMAGMYALQSVNSLSSSLNQAKIIKAQAAYQQRQADTNARLSMMQADDAIKRGDLQAGQIRRKASQIQGAQRVSAAAQGIDINSGSALDLQTETEFMSSNDIAMAKNNAWREAWGLRVQANQYTGQGRMAKIAGKYGAKQTVLTGGIKAAGYAMQSAYQFEKGQDDDVVKQILAGGKSYQAETPPEKKKPIGDSEPARMIASATDEANMRRWRSRQNPLFPGREMTNSWWTRYDEEA